MKRSEKGTDLLWMDFRKDIQTETDTVPWWPTASWELSEEIEEKASRKQLTCDPYLSHRQLRFGVCICRHVIIARTHTPSLTQACKYIGTPVRTHTQPLFALRCKDF